MKFIADKVKSINCCSMELNYKSLSQILFTFPIPLPQYSCTYSKTCLQGRGNDWQEVEGWQVAGQCRYEWETAQQYQSLARLLTHLHYVPVMLVLPS